MLEVFNMGIGLVLVVAKRNAMEVIERTAGKIIGQITPGSRKVLVT
jgi:phosphoribosylaminoimidazole (AIR) synthetase